MNGLGVFFDIDGLLANFVAGALAAHGREDIHPSRVPWGIEAVLGLTPEAFWSPLGHGFWANLEPYADGFALLRAAEELVGPERIGLLTSPCDTPGCVDGKREWVAKHLPAGYRRRLFVGSAKELFAGPTKVLIDDHNDNVDKFVAAGGRAVMPPRPWNRLASRCDVGGGFHVESVAELLKQAVDFAKGGAA